MTFENQLNILVAADAVFAFVADQRNIPKWNYYVVDVVQESGNGPAVGARYFQTRKTDSQHTAITQMEAGKSLTVESVAGTPVVRRHMEFRQMHGGTRLVDRWELRTGHPKVLELVAVQRVKRAVASNLHKLKHLLEQGEVQLQNGRIISIVI